MILHLVFGLFLVSPSCLALAESHQTEPTDSIPCLPDPLPDELPNETKPRARNWETGKLELETRNWTKLEYSVYYNCYDEAMEELDRLLSSDQTNDDWRMKADVFENIIRSGDMAARLGRDNITEAYKELRSLLIWIDREGRWAAENDHPELLELFISAGANFKPIDPHDRYFSPSILYAAAKGKSIESMKVLIDRGEDPRGGDLDMWDWINGETGTVLEEAMSTYKSPEQIPLALLGAGAKINTETTLSIAAANGYLEVVKILLERGSNVNQPDWQALEKARKEWEADINLQVEAKKMDPNLEEWQRHDRDYLVEEIRKAKWRNTTVDNIMYLSRIHPDLEPPIIAASRNGHHDIVTLLLENGADPDIKSYKTRVVDTWYGWLASTFAIFG